MILCSRSRSAIGAVIVGLMLFSSYYFFFIKSNFKKILIILLFVTVLPVFLFKTGEDKIDKFLKFDTYKNILIKSQVNLKSTPYPLPPTTSSAVTESFDIRKIVWEGAWKLALKYPLFGTGVETFAYGYNLVRSSTHNLTSEWDYVYNKAHNEYFNYLATTGFVGLISYLILIISFIFYVFLYVIPAKAGIQNKKAWIPFFKGMTRQKTNNWL
jgi:O-antigen ligase